MILHAVFLALAWMALTADFSPAGAAFGLLLGAALLAFMRGLGGGASMPRIRLHRVPGFLLYFLWEVVLANLRVAAAVLGPRRLWRPAIVAVPIDLEGDARVALLANLITLTPGTLSLEVSADRRVLYVHAMAVKSPDALRDAIRNGFERRLRELFA